MRRPPGSRHERQAERRRGSGPAPPPDRHGRRERSRPAARRSVRRRSEAEQRCRRRPAAGRAGRRARDRRRARRGCASAANMNWPADRFGMSVDERPRRRARRRDARRARARRGPRRRRRRRSRGARSRRPAGRPPRSAAGHDGERLVHPEADDVAASCEYSRTSAKRPFAAGPSARARRMSVAKIRTASPNRVAIVISRVADEARRPGGPAHRRGAAVGRRSAGLSTSIRVSIAASLVRAGRGVGHDRRPAPGRPARLDTSAPSGRGPRRGRPPPGSRGRAAALSTRLTLRRMSPARSGP